MKHLLILGLSTFFALSLVAAPLSTHSRAKSNDNPLLAQDENPTEIIIELNDYTVYEVKCI